MNEINDENSNTFCSEKNGQGVLYTYMCPPQINNNVYEKEGGKNEDSPLKLYKEHTKQ